MDCSASVPRCCEHDRIPEEIARKIRPSLYNFRLLHHRNYNDYCSLRHANSTIFISRFCFQWQQASLDCSGLRCSIRHTVRIQRLDMVRQAAPSKRNHSVQHPATAWYCDPQLLDTLGAAHHRRGCGGSSHCSGLGHHDLQQVRRGEEGRREKER